MPSKQQDVAQSDLLSVLFISVDGEPMSFYLRPGPSKSKLQPLITARGGLMCKVQQPGAILLIDPEEKVSIPESTAHWYVSTQYIHDCIEKDEQLNIEDYRLNPQVVQTESARPGNSKKSSPGLSGGRSAYTPEEDARILSYVSQHKAEVGGNRLWQQMEKQHVTSHTWQSMKYRYRVRLAQQQPGVKDVETTEEELKVEKEETEKEENPETEDAAPPQTHPVDTDLTQNTFDAEQENVEAQASGSPRQEVCVNPQVGEPAESTQVEMEEAETSTSPQTEALPQVEALPAESTEPKTDASLTNISPQKQNVPEDSQTTQPKPSPGTSSRMKTKEKEKASPEPDQPQRRATRRQLELEMPQPYTKKLRSAATSVKPASSSNHLSKKPKSAVKSAAQKDATVEQPPPKRARGTSADQQEENAQATVSETPPAESDAVPQTGEKKKEKRKLGILELATKEFEDESESEDEAPLTPNPAETVVQQHPTATDPLLSSSDTAADAVSTQLNPEPGPSPQENVQEAQDSRNDHPPETSSPQPAVTEPEAAAEPTTAAEVVQATSRAHLFIFDRESQEEESQLIFSDSAAAKAALEKDAAFSLTQDQLEEDKQRIRELINQTNQDLISVTKALLRTSGDFSAALDLLLNPSSISGPLWNRSDDSLLLSADPAVRQQLLEKFGEESVAKRIVFLEVES